FTCPIKDEQKSAPIDLPFSFIENKRLTLSFMETSNAFFLMGVCHLSRYEGVGTSSTLLRCIFLFAFAIEQAIFATLPTSASVKVLLAAKPQAPSTMTLTAKP